MLQIWGRRSSPAGRSCGTILWRTRRRPSSQARLYSTRPWCTPHCIRRSPYVPIFDYLQTNPSTLSCIKLAPRSTITLVFWLIQYSIVFLLFVFLIICPVKWPTTYYNHSLSLLLTQIPHNTVFFVAPRKNYYLAPITNIQLTL